MAGCLYLLSVEYLRKLIRDYWTPVDPKFRRILVFVFCALVVVIIALASLSSNSNQVPGSFAQAGSGSGQNGSGFNLGSSGSGGSGGTYAGASSPMPSVSLAEHLLVHVVGLVQNPGVYQLSVGSRVLDAVFAAGGFLPNADQGSINLARPLTDGEQLLVLAVGQSDSGTQASTSLININQANATQLDSLPGIGPTLAARIIDYRTANGGFQSVSDLGKVAGIGVALLAKLKPLVTL